MYLCLQLVFQILNTKVHAEEMKVNILNTYDMEGNHKELK